jgi:hypothetical protein
MKEERGHNIHEYIALFYNRHVAILEESGFCTRKPRYLTPNEIQPINMACTVCFFRLHVFAHEI